ncbi:DNA-binding response regulator [Sesbania bispinosa]|nr:DNA-binding response regulator [Sesbania bispinosa]
MFDEENRGGIKDRRRTKMMQNDAHRSKETEETESLGNGAAEQIGGVGCGEEKKETSAEGERGVAGGIRLGVMTLRRPPVTCSRVGHMLVRLGIILMHFMLGRINLHGLMLQGNHVAAHQTSADPVCSSLPMDDSSVSKGVVKTVMGASDIGFGGGQNGEGLMQQKHTIQDEDIAWLDGGRNDVGGVITWWELREIINQ